MTRDFENIDVAIFLNDSCRVIQIKIVLPASKFGNAVEKYRMILKMLPVTPSRNDFCRLIQKMSCFLFQ